MSFTIPDVIIPVDDGYATVNVEVEADRITAILPQNSQLSFPFDQSEIKPDKSSRVNGQNKLLLPGFFNAHTHSSEMWQRGRIRPLPLELWLAELYDFTPLDPEQVYLSALATAVETLLSGGTSIVDHLVLIPGQEIETVAAAVRAYQEIGIRVFIAPLIQDANLTAGIPDGEEKREHKRYIRSTSEMLALMEDLVDKFHHPATGVSILVAPTGIQLCSDALLAGCIELSERYNLCRHMHLLETKAQKLLAQEKYGYSGVEYLNRIGYLSSRTSLAHCVWLDDNDIAILAATGSTVVHNPLSNLRLGSGIAPILKYLQAGVNVVFACDGAASNDSQDLLEAIKIGSILHNTTDFDYRHWITPRQGIKMASLGGAKGLNMADELGSLMVGKKADLVLYDLTNLSLLPRTDPIGLLVLGRPSHVVDSVWVNGERVVADGKVTKVDVDELRKELFERSQWRVESKSAMVDQLESHYRQVMGLKA